MDMTTEPIRRPAWLVAVLGVVVPPVVAWLLYGDWRVALASSLVGLLPASGVVGYAESRRARTDSPATQAARVRRVAALDRTFVELPEDELDHGHGGV